jgi:hypothetical protein
MHVDLLHEVCVTWDAALLDSVEGGYTSSQLPCNYPKPAERVVFTNEPVRLSHISLTVGGWSMFINGRVRSRQIEQTSGHLHRAAISELGLVDRFSLGTNRRVFYNQFYFCLFP